MCCIRNTKGNVHAYNENVGTKQFRHTLSDIHGMQRVTWTKLIPVFMAAWYSTYATPTTMATAAEANVDTSFIT